MVSVIIPVYNTEKYLKRCLDSVLNQSYTDIEVIVVNDGSTDNSLQILKEYEKNDNRIKLIDQQNQGVSSARNTGLENVNGEYIIFIDSDDWVESNMFELLVENMSVSNSDISCCQYDKEVQTDISNLEVWTYDKSLTEFIKHQKLNGSLVNKLIKSEIVANVRFDTTIAYGEDALFFWEILLNSKSLCITNKVLYHVVLHGDSASGSGAYKIIRKDCIRVWNSIVDSARNIDEKYVSFAKAQLANMAFYSLYEMIYYKYENELHKTLFLGELKKNFYELKKATFVSTKVKIFSKIMIKNFDLSKFLISQIVKIKKYI